MTFFTVPSPDERWMFVYPRNFAGKVSAKLTNWLYDRGAYRDNKLLKLDMKALHVFLRNEVNARGWSETGSLGRDLAAVRFLEWMGFRNVILSDDATTFTSDVVVARTTFARRTHEVPAWLQIFYEQEIKTNRAGLTNQAVLSLWDSTKILYDYWLQDQPVLVLENKVEPAPAPEVKPFEFPDFEMLPY